MSTAYLVVKTAHLVFVIAWMAAIFYLPRILLNLREAGDVPAVRERLLLIALWAAVWFTPAPHSRRDQP